MPKPRKNSERRSTRGMLERVHFIDNALSRGEAVNCSTVGEMFGVGRDAVLDDVEQLKRMERPIDFDPKRNSYYYTEPVAPLPDKIITEGELFTIMVARSALEQYRGTPFFGRLARCFQKLAACVKTKVSFSAADYAARVSFKTMGTPKIDPTVFEAVSQGVAQRVQVAFDYRKPTDKEFKRRTVALWHFAQRGHMWYVIGYDPVEKARRTFALTRIRSPVLTSTRFEVPEDFSPDEHFTRAFSVLGGDGDHRIVIRFRGASAVRVRECEWHESEKWRDLGGGVVELELRLGALEEIERWVLSWGADAEVIEPKPLRERIVATIANLARAYGVEDSGEGEAAAG